MMRGWNGARLVGVAVVAAVLMLAAGTVRSAEDDGQPMGTVEFEEATAAAGIGYAWGHGVLTYKGKRHPFTIKGLTVGEVGGAKIMARGDVYHLHKLEDFNGTYTSVGAGATAAGGFDVEAMRNGNGVELKVVSTTKGADLRAAIEGVTITLK